VITLAKCLDHQNTKAPIKFHLGLELFVFLFLLFQARAFDHHHAITIIMIFIFSITWNVPPIS
jgi:hypothetical protein